MYEDHFFDKPGARDTKRMVRISYPFQEPCSVHTSPFLIPSPYLPYQHVRGTFLFDDFGTRHTQLMVRICYPSPGPSSVHTSPRPNPAPLISLIIIYEARFFIRFGPPIVPSIGSSYHLDRAESSLNEHVAVENVPLPTLPIHLTHSQKPSQQALSQTVSRCQGENRETQEAVYAPSPSLASLIRLRKG